jgi:hypothetical protein
MAFSFGRKGFAVRLNNGNHEWRFIARRNAWPVGLRGLDGDDGNFLKVHPLLKNGATAQGKYGSREKRIATVRQIVCTASAALAMLRS